MLDVAPTRDVAPPVRRRPLLVLWETTKACPLHCRHCRATAMVSPEPGELSTEEARRFLDGLREPSSPPPVLVLSGGDCLQRDDLLALVAHARDLGIRTAISPSVSPAIFGDRVAQLARLGVRQVSISLDGAAAGTHDGVRGIDGHFALTERAIAHLVHLGLHVQVNTTVMRSNAHELARIAGLLRRWGVRTWEVFFLVDVGRAASSMALGADELEDVCWFLAEAAERGLVVRTVEGPFYRRVLAERAAGAPPRRHGRLHGQLLRELRTVAGDPSGRSAPAPPTTADGMGVVFVAHDGAVFPSGFLPRPLGNVRHDRLLDLYRESPELQAIRSRTFHGACGRCEYAGVCGGSRARAFAATGDLLGEDPACVRSDAWASRRSSPALRVSRP